MKFKIGLVYMILIVLSNYLVQLRINDWITYGAILFPIGFLLTDVINEKYGEQVSIDCLRIGILLAFIPTLLLVDYRIAIASIVSYFTSQFIDIKVFTYLKNKYKDMWYIRNNVSTFISQFVDSFLFFFIAFYWTIDIRTIFTLSIVTFGIKYLIALVDTPIFYILTQRKKND